MSEFSSGRPTPAKTAPAVMRTYSTAVAYWSGLNPNSLSTIIEAPQATIEALNGAFSPSSEGVVLLAAKSVSRGRRLKVPRRGAR